MSSTSATGLPIMTSGDAPNIPADVGINLAGALDKVTVPLFASTSARDAAYATTPFGLCFVGASVDAGTLYRRRGGSWYEIKDVGSLIGPVVTNAITAQTDWTMVDQSTRKVLGRVEFTCGATYTGTGFATTATGALTDVAAVAIGGIYSPLSMSRVFLVSASDGDQVGWTAGIYSGGVIRLQAGPPSKTIASGTTFVFTGMYPTAS
jgi:hypothetical protein